MQAVVSFLQSIVNSLSSIADILITFVEDCSYTTELCLSFLPQIPDLLSFLPPQVVGIFGMTFAVAIVFILRG